MSKAKKPPRLVLKPTNLTTDIGTANYNPISGEVSSSLSPELAAIKDLFYGSAMDFAPTEGQSQYASDLFDLGSQRYLQAANLDTNQMTQDYYNQLQQNLQPSRALEDARLGDTLFKSGRTGYGTGYQGGGYINPEQYSVAKAREEANASMLLNSQDRARLMQQQDLQTAGGYMNLGNALALQPYQNVAGITGLGTDIASLSTNLLNPLGQFSQQQLQTQMAVQQNEAARAAASGGGGFLGGLGGSVLNAGLNYATGGGSSLFGGVSSLFNNNVAPNLFSAIDGSSPSSSLFGTWQPGNFGSVNNATNFYPRF